MLPYNKNIKTLSRNLRKNMTDQEKILWSKLRRKQLKGMQFYRQKIIGNYIVDFYCARAKLVIEIDGSQHYQGLNINNDNKREEYLRSLGLNVLRFSNMEIRKNIDGVLQTIYENL